MMVQNADKRGVFRKKMDLPPPNLLKENEKGGEKKPWRKE